MNTKLQNVRISYARLFEPRAFAPGDPEKYSTQILIPKDDKENLEKLKNAIESAKEDLGKKVKPKISVWRDGDTDSSANDATAGHIFFNASASDKPPVVGKSRQPLTKDEIWSGCYCNVIVSIYGTLKGGAKVCAGLNGVQLVQHGDRLDGRQSVEQMFEELEPLPEDDTSFVTID